MEYLMTYGWAILIVIIVAAALYAMGVFNPGTFTQSAATGFSNFNVPTGGWKLTSGGALTLQLKNGVGSRINVTSITATQGTSTATNSTPVALGPGEKQTFTFSGLSGGTSGSSYSVEVEITYDNLESGLTGFKSSGTLTGTIS